MMLCLILSLYEFTYRLYSNNCSTISVNYEVAIMLQLQLQVDDTESTLNQVVQQSQQAREREQQLNQEQVVKQ